MDVLLLIMMYRRVVGVFMLYLSIEWFKCGIFIVSCVEGVGKNFVNENKKLFFFFLVMW